MLIFSTLTEKSRSLWCRKPFMHFTFLLLTGSLESLSEYPLKPTSLFVTEGELEALPGMWPSCCFLGNVVLCEWQMQGNVERATLESCHWVSAGYRILNNNAVFCIFVPILPLSILSLYLSLLFFSLYHFSFTNQGFEKGWSDYRGTAEEDREQPQSSRISHQEWPSTSLKKKKKKT